MTLRDLWQFGRGFAARPLTTGAVVPSSAALGGQMLEGLDWRAAGVVVELGPGTGAFTAEILRRLRPGARFFALEVNPEFAATVRRRHPQVPVHEVRAADLAEACRREGVEAVDCVVSSLPWASFADAEQRDSLAAVSGMLAPGGQFVTFAYVQGLLLPPGRRFRRLLPHYFSDVRRSRTTWLNLPPAFVYRCRK